MDIGPQIRISAVCEGWAEVMGGNAACGSRGIVGVREVLVAGYSNCRSVGGCAPPNLDTYRARHELRSVVAGGGAVLVVRGRAKDPHKGRAP